MENPHFKTEEIHGVMVLALRRNLMGLKSDEFSDALEGITGGDNPRVVVNLEKCEYASSPNLALLVQFKKKLVAKGGDLKIARPNAILRALLDSTNLSKVFEIFGSVEVAVLSFEKTED